MEKGKKKGALMFFCKKGVVIDAFNSSMYWM